MIQGLNSYDERVSVFSTANENCKPSGQGFGYVGENRRQGV